MPIEAAFDDKDVVADKQESCGYDSNYSNGYNGETATWRMQARPKEWASTSRICAWWKSLRVMDHVAFSYNKIHHKEMGFLRSSIYTEHIQRYVGKLD